MRTDDLYLADIVQAAESVSQFVAGLDETRFVADDLVRSAVLHKLTVIGEAAARGGRGRGQVLHSNISYWALLP